MLHLPTLLFALVLTDVVLAASLWVAIARTARRGVTAWSLSLLLQATFFVLAAAAGPAPGVAIVAVSNGLAALGYTMQLAAILAWHERRLPAFVHVAAAVLCAASLGPLAAEPRLRVVVGSSFYGLTALAIAVIAHRLPREGASRGGPRGKTLLAFGLSVGGAIMLVRASFALASPMSFAWFAPPASGAGATTLSAGSALAAHVVTIVSSLGFLLLHRERQERELERLAMTDPLTGAYNRRTLFDLGEREVLRARREGSSIAVVILDIDHFKRVNDTFGHQAGDAVLVRLVQLATSCLRTTDLLARYGGEEFCLVLPAADREAARGVVERIRETIEASSITHGDATIRITSSAGVAASGANEPADTADLTTLVRRADEALYRAKAAGRNRVVMAEAA